VAPIWSELTEAAKSSFFLSTQWTECWLKVFTSALEVSIPIVESGGQPVGACLLVAANRRHARIPISCVSLNTSGEPAADTVYLECNDLLCRPGWEQVVANSIAHHLAKLRWDAVALDGCCDGAGIRALRGRLTTLEQSIEASIEMKKAFYIDLDIVRASTGGYEASLGKSTRKNLKYNLRHYSQIGPIRVAEAQTAGEAYALLDRLAEMHQRRWTRRGLPGAFASSPFREFHRELIRRCYPGAVQLVEVSAAGETIGILYNFVHRGVAYFYQCGFAYSDDSRWSPGIVTLYYGILHCLDAGLREYNLLSGAELYKELLATGSREMMWAVFRRPKLRFHIIDGLRRAKRWAHHHV